MKGLVKAGFTKDTYGVRYDLEEPAPGYGQVKIKVAAGAICGSDIHLYDMEKTADGRYRFPVVIGHEGSGVVTEVGEGVKGIRVGDRVVAETTVEYCNTCEYCREAYYNCCNERRGLGSAANGFFGEYVVSPERFVHVLPDHISMEAASLMEPLTCAVHGVLDQSSVHAGHVAVVSGPGPIGLLTAQVAKAQGCMVVLLGRTSSIERLRFAKEVLDIPYVIDIKKEDPKKFIMDLTDGLGCDAYFECAGARDSILLGFELVKKMGEFICNGVLMNELLEFDFGSVLYGKELSIKGVKSTNPKAWDEAMRLVKYKLVDLESMVSCVLPVEQWQEGFDLMRSRKAIKVVLKP
ncbi:MAG: alcohol dehydrogenase catalytic domain-containing protein [Erysipelotrichaceae bacterium]|nr:alcohol dehydrogenase catalytic domain-containing protein [Erysipelotrichaceae bacterium]